MTTPIKHSTANYVHACQQCDKCDGCALECEHAPKFTMTTSNDCYEGADEELRAIIQQQVADDPIKYLGENI